MSIRSLYNRFFLQGSERTIKTKKNVVLIAIYRGLSILITFLLVPITLNYVDSGTYGIWLTLSSIVGWISFFDIGINNGLKNRLTEALAKNDSQLGKTYISTTYAMLSIIFFPLLVLLMLIIPHIDWNSLLNIQDYSGQGLSAAMCIIAAFFCLNFILSTINVVIFAHQDPADASLCTLFQQVVSLLVIYLLTLTTEGSLVNLCIGLCLSPLIVISLYNIILFKGRYKDLSPSIKCVDFKRIPDLLKLGLKFFVIQFAGVIQFQLVNFLIIRNFGSDEVTSYNIAYKYFNILFMLWSILITPIWAAVTDAKIRKDFDWITNMQKKFVHFFWAFLCCGILMLLVSSFVFKIWVGDKVQINFSLSAWLLVYNLVLIFGSIFVNILNGLGELNLQTIACCISPIVFILFSTLLIKVGVGVESILIASIVANFNGFLLAPLQYKHLMRKYR